MGKSLTLCVRDVSVGSHLAAQMNTFFGWIVMRVPNGIIRTVYLGTTR